MTSYKVNGRSLESWIDWQYETDEVRELATQWQQLDESREALRKEQLELELRAEELRRQRVEELWPDVEAALPEAAKQVAALLREHGLTHEGVVEVGPVRVRVQRLWPGKNISWSGWETPTVNLGAWGDKGAERELAAETVRDLMAAEGVVADTWLSDAGVSCRVASLRPAEVDA